MADLYDLTNLICNEERISGLGAAYYRGKHTSEGKTTYQPNGLLPLRNEKLTEKQISALQMRAI